MSRFHQRLRANMRDAEFAAAFQEAYTEVALQHALDQVRERRQLTKGQLAERMGVHREAVSRILTAEQSNPTLSTITSLLLGLEVAADIQLRAMKEGDAPINVAISSDITGMPSSGGGSTTMP